MQVQVHRVQAGMQVVLAKRYTRVQSCINYTGCKSGVWWLTPGDRTFTDYPRPAFRADANDWTTALDGCLLYLAHGQPMQDDDQITHAGRCSKIFMSRYQHYHSTSLIIYASR